MTSKNTINPERAEQIDRWAKYVRTSNGEWKKQHTLFIDAQIQKANDFYKRLSKQPLGKEKIIKIFGIKNPDAIPLLR